ncbi:hypothetical protein [Eikenella corrodens]|uniref:hypothetical protein n=1 Tax=Eikenella corrodens TaxID=539 RepID=UPI00129AC0F1|nr:hypothetical protein [Eikenella corrodens]
MLNKSDVKEFCVRLAGEYPGWEYKASVFKNKTLKHSEVWIDTGWVLHLSAMPSVIVYNKSVNKIFKEGFNNFQTKWTARMLILSPDAHNHCMIYQKLVHTLPDAEAYIRDFFELGLDLVERYFSNPDEKEFLAGYPIYGEFPAPSTDDAYEGLGNCIARAILLDFDYVERFIKDDFPTVRPIYEPYRERVAQWLPIWKERAAETGSILPPKK